jgi:hypothetical protein
MAEAKIRALVARYVAGELPLDELERSLPDGWELDQAGDRTLRRFVLQIMGRIAEFRHGDYDEAALRKNLAEFGEWAKVVTTVRALAKTSTLWVVRPETQVQFFGADTSRSGAAA